MPISNTTHMASFFRERHGIDVSQTPWHISLVRMAIPYAENAVTVVAPDGYSLPPIVLAEARRRRVEVRLVPASYFPRQMIRDMSMKFTVPYDIGPDKETKHAKYAEQVLGEKMTAGRHLLPRQWQSIS
jgi:hypothetical protein